MIVRILLAVDDSPDSLAAARLAIHLAGALAAPLRVVHVSADETVDAALERASSTASVVARRGRSDQVILDRITAMAAQAGISVDQRLLAGPVGPAILDAAQEFDAGLIVIGKSARSASGEPYVGSQTRHVLEFSNQPVLVVPPARPAST